MTAEAGQGEWEGEEECAMVEEGQFVLLGRSEKNAAQKQHFWSQRPRWFKYD